MDSNLISVIIASVGSGIVSSLGTIAALKVHIVYLKEATDGIKERLSKVEQSAQRAHGRVDLMETIIKVTGNEKN